MTTPCPSGIGRRSIRIVTGPHAGLTMQIPDVPFIDTPVEGRVEWPIADTPVIVSLKQPLWHRYYVRRDNNTAWYIGEFGHGQR